MFKKFKLVIVALVAALVFACAPQTASAQMTEGQAAAVGFVLGHYVSRHNRQTVIVQQAPMPQSYYVQPPMPVYNNDMHGYCAPYSGEQYYHCLGNMQRKRNEDAYIRGLTGR